MPEGAPAGGPQVVIFTGAIICTVHNQMFSGKCLIIAMEIYIV